MKWILVGGPLFNKRNVSILWNIYNNVMSVELSKIYYFNENNEKNELQKYVRYIFLL